MEQTPSRAPWWIFGLGNPGPRYDGTRHNVGFAALDRLTRRWELVWSPPGAGQPLAWSAEGAWRDTPVRLFKPSTYMNLSGAVIESEGVERRPEAERLLVLYDDADLELGRTRLRRRGGAGGHNGVRSVIEAMGTEGFPRLKLGVRGTDRPGGDLVDYVLRPFDGEEGPAVNAMLDRAVDAVECVLADGVDVAMNRYNRPLEAESNDESRADDASRP